LKLDDPVAADSADDPDDSHPGHLRYPRLSDGIVNFKILSC